MPRYHFPPEAGHVIGEGTPNARAIEAELDRRGLAHPGVTLARREDKAVLEGQVPDADLAERLVLAIGNLRGVAEVDDRLATQQPGLLQSLGSFAHMPAGAVRTEAAEAAAHQARIDEGAAYGPAGSLFHVLREGETLEALAQRFYADPRMARRILAANPDLLHEGAAPEPGLVVRLPQR